MASVPDRWLSRIAIASTADEIVVLANDYAHSLTEGERMRLPPACLPPASFTSAQDVNNYALTLTRAHLAFRGALSSEVLLERLMTFFATLSSRIAQIERITRSRAAEQDLKARTRS
jgi:hypothetical protein